MISFKFPSKEKHLTCVKRRWFYRKELSGLDSPVALPAVKRPPFSSTSFAGPALSKELFSKISYILKWLPCCRLEKIR